MRSVVACKILEHEAGLKVDFQYMRRAVVEQLECK